MNIKKLIRIQDDNAKSVDKRLALISKFEDTLTEWLEEDTGISWSKGLYFELYRGRTITVKLKKEEVAVVEVYLDSGEYFIKLRESYKGINIMAKAVFDYIEGVIETLPH